MSAYPLIVNGAHSQPFSLDPKIMIHTGTKMVYCQAKMRFLTRLPISLHQMERWMRRADPQFPSWVGRRLNRPFEFIPTGWLRTTDVLGLRLHSHSHVLINDRISFWLETSTEQKRKRTTDTHLHSKPNTKSIARSLETPSTCMKQQNNPFLF